MIAARIRRRESGAKTHPCIQYTLAQPPRAVTKQIMENPPETSADLTREQIKSLLRFYQESGLDFPVGDAAVNRFEAVEEPKSTADISTEVNQAEAGKQSNPHAPESIEMDPRKRQAEAPQRPVAVPASDVTIPNGAVVEKAAETAEAAKNLDALRTSVETFDGCNLKRSARSTVFEGGTRGAPLMVIGGTPSRDDDVSGAAFSGADGALLEKMLLAIGLSHRTDVYFGFCVPWSPPGNSAPTPLHLELCAPFLARQIQLAKPKIVVVLGNVAMRHVFQTKQTIMQARGKWTVLPDFDVPAIAICDPAMLRAQPRLKKGAWYDLLSVKDKLSATELLA